MNEMRFREAMIRYVSNKCIEFHANSSIDCKVKKIADYLQKHNIKDVIVGVSGGIDSAVVFALLIAVKRDYIPSLKVRGYCITFNEVYGHVFKSSYVDKMRNTFCENDDITITTVDGTATLKGLVGDLQLSNDRQLLAQSSYALRYQMFFTLAQAYGGITVGTTNKDEFDYVGWFGKNSDMVVDIQVITDWHKFEVIEAAKWLGVPTAIIERAPSGDLIDSSSDEDNFGCTYNELAFREQAYKVFSHAPEFLALKYKKVEELHKKNAHKYQGQTFNPVFIN